MMEKIETFREYRNMVECISEDHSVVSPNEELEDACRQINKFEEMVANAIDDNYLKNNASMAFRQEIEELRSQSDKN